MPIEHPLSTSKVYEIHFSPLVSFLQELGAALIALENDLHSITPDLQPLSSPVRVTHQFWQRQLSLMHKLIPPCDSWRSNHYPSLDISGRSSSVTVHDQLNYILAEVNHIQRALTETLIRGLNTHVLDCKFDLDSDQQIIPRITYDLCLKLPSDSDLKHVSMSAAV